MSVKSKSVSPKTSPKILETLPIEILTNIIKKLNDKEVYKLMLTKNKRILSVINLVYEEKYHNEFIKRKSLDKAFTQKEINRRVPEYCREGKTWFSYYTCMKRRYSIIDKRLNKMKFVFKTHYSNGITKEEWEGKKVTEIPELSRLKEIIDGDIIGYGYRYRDSFIVKNGKLTRAELSDGEELVFRIEKYLLDRYTIKILDKIYSDGGLIVLPHDNYFVKEHTWIKPEDNEYTELKLNGVIFSSIDKEVSIFINRGELSVSIA